MSKTKTLSYITVAVLLAALTGCGAMGGPGGYQGAGAGVGSANQVGKYGQ